MDRRTASGFLLVGVVSTLYLYRLGALPLEPWDEGIYALSAFRVVESGNWLVPQWRFGGAKTLRPFLEKPPLIIWIQALSIKILGPSVFAARLPNALAATGIALLAAWIGAEQYDARAGVAAGLGTATARPLLMLRRGGRSAGVDPVFTLFGLLALVIAWRAIITADDRTRHRLWAIVGICAGAALMIKGLAAGVFVIMGAPMILLNPRRAILGATGAALVALIAAAPWHLYMIISYPDFINQYLLEQVLGRASGDIGTVGDPLLSTSNYPYFKRAFWDWGYHIVAPVVGAAAIFARYLANDNSTDLQIIAWWALVVPLTFSLVGGNNKWYVIPATLPMGLLAGYGGIVVLDIVRDHVSAIGRRDIPYVSLQVVVLLSLIATAGLATHYDIGTREPLHEFWGEQNDIAEDLGQPPHEGTTLYIDTAVRGSINAFIFKAEARGWETVHTPPSQLQSDSTIQWAFATDKTLNEISRPYTVVYSFNSKEIKIVRFG